MEAKFVYARALLLCDAGEFGDQWKVADVATALGVLDERYPKAGKVRLVVDNLNTHSIASLY